MKRFPYLFLLKSNSCIPLCFLLLFFFTPLTLYAAELPTIPIETPTLPTEEAPADKTYYITSLGGLNIRSGPSIQYDIIGSIPYGDEITITRRVDTDWFEIPFAGTKGYISAKYVSTQPVTTLPLENEEMPEVPETPIAEIETEENVLPLVSDTTMIILLLAIISILVLIIITVISFFRNHPKYDSDKYDHTEAFDYETYDDSMDYDEDEYDNPGN